MNQHTISINNNCVGCKLCINDCPAHNIKLVNKKASIITQECIMCGHCEAICPKEAVSISGYDENTVKKQAVPKLDPDDLLQVIRLRRTIRNFKDQDIPKSVVDQILEAGRLTHTSKNAQDVSFRVIDQQKDAIEAMAVRMIRKLKPMIDVMNPLARQNEIHDHFFFFEAPKVIVICAKDPINAILAAQNMEFVAEANGLGVLYSGFFTTAIKLSRKLKKTLAIPHGKKAVVTLVLGYPNVTYQRSPKRKHADVAYL